MNYLFAALYPTYVHKNLFGKGAIFDLEQGQQGWEEIQQIQVGDQAAVINSNRNIPLLYEVTKFEKSETQIVVFGKPIKRIDMSCDKFIRLNNITNNRITSKHQMGHGFNLATWEYKESILHTIIAENDESQWEDQTGVLYHFPKRYAKSLEPGSEVIYYKGKLKNVAFRESRLSDFPHYFAKARIGKIYPDQESEKGDLFATIVEYSPFSRAILAKNNDEYFEIIPESQKANYWRNGVRAINKPVYERILSQLNSNEISEPTANYQVDFDLNDSTNELESLSEGLAKTRYVTTYERNPKYRKQAIAIHGCSCIACGFNFGSFYGEYAEGYIHIHHILPVSEFDAPKSIDPETDLVPLCANCHSVVHRKKAETLSIKKLQSFIDNVSNKIKQDS